jgi:hypothetical protein
MKLRARSNKLLIWLRSISICIGKFIVLRRKKQFARSVNKIKVRLMPLVTLWVRQKRKKYRRVLVKTVESQLSCTYLTKLIDKWLGKMKFIQSTLKNALFFKVSLYDSLLYKWNQTEFRMFDIQQERRGRRRIGSIIKNMKIRSNEDGPSSIPIDVKVYYIRSVIKEVMRNYLHEQRSYKAQFNSIHRQNLYAKRKLDQEINRKYPIPPNKPDLYNYFTPDKFVIMINNAIGDRVKWSGLISEARKTERNRK